ncbi:thioredoxin [Tenuifilaceae bacterium CYCD]|nr:thioredoxin [Tenuifilaceae bacterium CYCD]
MPKTFSIMLNEPNSLINEVSPYLLQHSYNPVKWYAWNDETLEIARKENKMLLISIGYSSCHWCHVMEKESFIDFDVAEIMNRNYICIKVDREERPDIDQIYINAVQIITRRGGWPLNCFALPDGRPIYGGTYFPKDQWKNILESLQETWINEPEKVKEVAEELAQGISNSEIINRKTPVESLNIKESLNNSIHEILPALDFRNGGTAGAPKFPMPGFLKLLLKYSFHSSNAEITKFVDITLGKVANGGIYDHIGGGFFRYAVDEKWHVPHFEKMLYDNAQLVELYSLAYRVNPNPLYKKIVEETVNFLEHELQSPNGGFYNSLDADSNGQEGEFYTWRKDEIEKILEYDSELFCSALGVTPVGNWENTNILRRCITNEQLEAIFNLPSQEIDYRLNRSIIKLRNERNKHILPLVDDKIITSWNGLLISALAQAYISFSNKQYLELALLANSYIENNHFVDGALKRISCKEKVYTDPFLDDYSNYINALIILYNATLNKEWINKADALLQKAISDFWDSNSGMFFYTPSNNKLIARKMELIDGVIPSANAQMATNLLQLAGILQNENYKSLSTQMLANIAENISSSGLFVYAWVEQFLAKSLPLILVKTFKNDIEDINKIQCNTIYPNIIFEKIDGELKPEIQVCYGNSCQEPETDTNLIIDRINRIKLNS